MAIAVSQQKIEEFQKNGAVVLRAVVDDKWLKNIKGAIEVDILRPGPFYHGYKTEDGEGNFHGNLRTWEHYESLHEFCFQSHLPLIAKTILRSNKVNLLYDQLFIKEPSTPHPTRWHNDQPYWPIDGKDVLSIWVALDQTTKENGRLEFISGSHLWNSFYQPEAFGETVDPSEGYEKNPNYEKIPDIDANRGDFDIISFDLKPGDVYVFHGLTVHGSGGNFTNSRRRRGYSVRYTGDDVTYSARLGTHKDLRNHNLHDGDPLDSNQYPLIFS